MLSLHKYTSLLIPLHTLGVIQKQSYYELYTLLSSMDSESIELNLKIISFWKRKNGFLNSITLIRIVCHHLYGDASHAPILSRAKSDANPSSFKDRLE